VPGLVDVLGLEPGADAGREDEVVVAPVGRCLPLDDLLLPVDVEGVDEHAGQGAPADASGGLGWHLGETTAAPTAGGELAGADPLERPGDREGGLVEVGIGPPKPAARASASRMSRFPGGRLDQDGPGDTPRHGGRLTLRQMPHATADVTHPGVAKVSERLAGLA
jgi:hypothetical protein